MYSVPSSKASDITLAYIHARTTQKKHAAYTYIHTQHTHGRTLASQGACLLSFYPHSSSSRNEQPCFVTTSVCSSTLRSNAAMRVQLLGELVHTCTIFVSSLLLGPKQRKWRRQAAAAAFSFLSYNRKKVAQLRSRAQGARALEIRQYNTLVRWVDGTNESSTKHLTFQVSFFS